MKSVGYHQYKGCGRIEHAHYSTSTKHKLFNTYLAKSIWILNLDGSVAPLTTHLILLPNHLQGHVGSLQRQMN